MVIKLCCSAVSKLVFILRINLRYADDEVFGSFSVRLADLS